MSRRADRGRAEAARRTAGWRRRLPRRAGALGTALAAAALTALAVVAVGLAFPSGQSASGPAGATRGVGSTAAVAAVRRRRPVRRSRRGGRGPRGFRGLRGARGPAGPPGPAATGVARSLTINWRSGAFPGRDGASVEIPGIGRLDAVCNPTSQQLVLHPAADGVRTVATVDDYQSASSSVSTPQSQSTATPIAIGLPPNGMLSITFSVQPVAGVGGPGPPPASMQLSSEYVVNGSSVSTDFCYIAGQVLQATG